MPVENLSPHARALLCSQWMIASSTLRYGMVVSVPSPEAEDALGQLTSAGLVARVDEDLGGRVYSLTEAGRAADRRPPGDTLAEKLQFIEDHGSFPLAVRREPTDAAQPGF